MNRFIVPLLALLAGIVIGVVLWPSSSVDSDAKTTNQADPEILYWVAPMDSSYRRDNPGKSPMGMDLVPVYAGQEASVAGTVRISPNIVQSIGVTTAIATTRAISEPVLATGVVEVAEDHIFHVHPRVSGWIENLAVTTDGQPVQKGDILYTLYSPELVNAQEEFLLARRRNNQSLLNAARERLKALQVPENVIQTFEKTGKVQQQIAFPVPQDGYVTNLNIRPGFYVTPGTTMLAIASLKSVWITADIPQRYAGNITAQQPVTVTLPAFPGDHFSAKADFVYPELDPQSRTLKVRVVLENTDSRLKPNMLAMVTFDAQATETLSIPRSALIRTAANNRVVLALGNGEFRSTAVQTGQITAQFAEITAGLNEGDKVVMNGAFLIDSESAIDADLSRISGVANTPEDDNQWVVLSIQSVDNEAAVVTASHGPVEAWEWPAMTMDFAINSAVDSTLLNEGIRVNAQLSRDNNSIVQITAIDPNSISSSVSSATVEGVINSIDVDMRSLNISRGPIKKWGRGPATMDFLVSDPITLKDWQPEQAIRFTFEISNGNFVITHIEPAMAMSHDMDHAGH